MFFTKRPAPFLFEEFIEAPAVGNLRESILTGELPKSLIGFFQLLHNL